MKIPRLDDNHIPVDAERLMNMDSVDEWLAKYQSVKHFANEAHKQITAQHYEIQAFKAQIERFMTLDIHDRDIRDELWRVQHDTPAQSLLLHDVEVLDRVDKAIFDQQATGVQVCQDIIRDLAKQLRQQAEENDNERIS